MFCQYERIGDNWKRGLPQVASKHLLSLLQVRLGLRLGFETVFIFKLG